MVVGLGGARRRRLHARIAAAIAERPGVPPAEVARQLQEAGPEGDPVEAAEWSRRAGAESAAALAWEEAASHYERALTALAAVLGAGARERAELIATLGDAHDRAGRRDAARAAFAEAAALARELGDGDLLARCALGYGGLGVTILRSDPGTVERLELALDAVGSDELRARLLARLAIEIYYDDRGRADSLSAEAVAVARASGDATALASALSARRVAIWSAEQATERLGVTTEIVEAAGRAGDAEGRLQGRNWRVTDLLELGRLDEVEREIELYSREADVVGLPHYRWYVPLWQGGLAILAGRFGEADELRERALELGRSAQDANAELLASVQAAHSLAEQRRFDEIDLDWMERRRDQSPAPAAWDTWLCMFYAEAGRIDDARALLESLAADDFARLPRDANWHTICELAITCATLGDRERAARLYELLLPHAHLVPVIARAVCCYGSAEYFVARLAATAGFDDAELHFQAALEEHERLGAAPRLALTRRRYGEYLLERGEESRARELLAAAG